MSYGVFQNGWMIGNPYETVFEANEKIEQKYRYLFSNLEVKEIERQKSIDSSK